MHSFLKSVLFLAVTFCVVTLSSANKEVHRGVIGKTSGTMFVQLTTEKIPEMLRNTSTASLDDLIAYMEQCNGTFYIDPSYIESLNTSGSFPDETERTPMCFICCVLNKMDVMNMEGVFNQLTAEKFFELQFKENDVSDVIATCIADRKETDICDRAYKLIRCAMEKLLKE